MEIYDYKEMLESDGEMHFIRNLKESGMNDKEINKILQEIYELFNEMD